MSPPSVSQPETFLRHASSFLRLEIDPYQGAQFQHQQNHQDNYHYPQQQQTVSSLLPGSGLLHEPSLQLDVPEIEDWYTSGMNDVLNDFPAITTDVELPPLASPSNDYFDRGPIHQIPTSTQLPEYTAQQISLEERSRTTRPPESKSTIPPTNSARTWNLGVKIPKAPGLRGRDVSYKLLESSTTALEPFNPGGSSASWQYQRVSEKSKELSNMEKLDHVQRERHRRNDMSIKISTLQGILPPLGANLKRDRAAVVHDTVQYLKFLQERVQVLKRTLTEMKLTTSTSGAVRRVAVLNMGKPVLPTSSNYGRSKLVEYCVHVEGDGEGPLIIEKCRCRSDFMSNAMKILEHLNLDVGRCTVTKMFDYTIFVIIAKPRLTASSQAASSAAVVSAFRSSLQLS